jgi:hypothetical protein
MRLYALILPLLFLPPAASSDSATQNDWSGGPGVWGPAISFGDEFYSDSGVECFATLGGVSLDLIDQVWAHALTADYDGARCALTADIDGDGDMDVVSAAYSAGDVTWWENSDIGSIWIEHTVDGSFTAAASVCAGDFDGDGDVDIAAGSEWEDGVAWWANLDGSGNFWRKRNIDLDFTHTQCVRSADLNEDGTSDILGTSMSLDQIAWWRNLGGSWSAKYTIAEDAIGARCACAGDIDGDGTLDVVGNSNGAEISWWDNLDQAGIPGPGTSWEKHLVAVQFMNVWDVHCADVNGDGNLDIIGAAYASGIMDDVSWWQNADGVGGSWAKHVVDGDFWGVRSVDAADMDADGDMDILGASYHESEIAWWENLDGSGTSWRKHLIDHPMGGATSVCAEDIDGDGILDVLGAGYLENLISWYDVKTYPPEGWLVSSVLDVSCGPDWGTLDWTADAPVGTSVAFQVRSSADPDSTAMGPWSDTLFTSCSLHGILPDWEQYFQYRAILMTSDNDITPSLQGVSVTWNPLGIDGSVPFHFELLPVRPNPCAGTPGIEFGMPVEAMVGISLFDISGRLVHEITPAEYEPGWHEIQLEVLRPGIYFIRMRAGEFAASRRFVVLE